MFGFGKKKRLPLTGRAATVSVADMLASIHWCTKHIHGIESGMFDRVRALELRVQQLEAKNENP